MSYVVEGTTNLVAWAVLKTNAAPDGVSEYLDATGGRPWRFYRAKEQ